MAGAAALVVPVNLVVCPAAMELSTAYLADHPNALPVIEEWFKSEWPDWYGPEGPGDARSDLLSYATRDALPVGVVGFVGDAPVGLVVLKATSISGRPDLAPWASTGLVHSDYRRRGFGAKLLSALEEVAVELGYDSIYCGTAAAALLLERSGWTYVEHSEAEGQHLAVYKKSLLREPE